MNYRENVMDKLNDHDIYLSYLINEYLSVRGISDFDKFSLGQKHDFYSWVESLVMMRHSYRNILEYLNVPYRKSCTVEYGKGIYDTILLPYDNSSIVTPYTSSFVSEDYRRVIYGDIKSLLVCDYLFDFFLLTNPQGDIISNWDSIESLSDVDISVGVYGNNHDKNKEMKLEMIEELKKNISGKYVDEYLNFDGCYFSLIVTKDRNYKVRKKIKTT